MAESLGNNNYLFRLFKAVLDKFSFDESGKLSVSGISDIEANTRVTAKGWALATPSDTTTYNPDLIAGIVITASGDVFLGDENGNILPLTSVEANTDLPYRPTKIRAATTATVYVLYK